DPTSDPTATLIERVERIDATIESYAGGAVSARSRGGMRTKLQAAKLATAGAVHALRDRGRSLLPAGVVQVDGPFRRGDIVAIHAPDGERIAYGIANYGD